MSAKGSVLKRVRQSEKRKLRNKHYRSLLHSTAKKVLSENKKEKAVEELSAAFKVIDKIAAKKVIHKRKASNKKSALSKHVNSLK